MKRYIYTGVMQKFKSNKNIQCKRLETTYADQDPEQSNTFMTEGSMDLNCKAESAQSYDNSHQKMLLPSSEKARDMVSSNGWYELQKKLLSRNQHGYLRTLMFTGIDHGIGVTTAVANFARALAGSSNRKVLIIDTNLQTPKLHSIFQLNRAEGIAELFLSNGVKTCAIKKVADSQLSVITCGMNCTEGANYFDREHIDMLIKEASDRFDFIILDTAPITKFADSQAICSLADGVLLVIQAGKTRPQQALRAKKELEDAGGKLLGVILNKRKYYIPNWVYRRL